MLKEGESVPEIFEDPVVKRASHWVLSTSALFSTNLREYGWGEVRLIAISLARVNELYKSCQMASASHTSPDSTARAPGVFCALFFLYVAWKTDVMGMNRLSPVHNHVVGGDAQQGVCGGDFACGGGPVFSVLPGGELPKSRL